MTNVYYIVPSLINSGPIRVVFDIVKNLNREEFTPIVIALSKHKLKNRYCKQWFDDLGITVIEYSYSKWNLQFNTKFIARSIESVFPQNSIFHAHGYYPAIILAHMTVAKSIVTLHNICKEDFLMSKGNILGSYMSYTYLRALKKIDISVAISYTVENWYKNIDKNLNLLTIYNGVNIDSRYLNSDINDIRVQVRKELDIDSEKKVLIYPAGFNIRKNHIQIIKELYTSKRDDFVVLFIGHGPTENMCQNEAANDKRFMFIGYKMDVFKYYVASDYLITSSKSEGFGLVLAEAMSYGLPCIVSDIPVHKELIQSVFDNVDDLVFSLLKPGDLRNKVEANLDLKYDNDTIQYKSQSLFSSLIMAKQYEDIYRLDDVNR